jgi:hypothetical protein
MSLTRLSRQKPPQFSLRLTLLTRLLSSSSTTSSSFSKLHQNYSFEPPPSLSPTPQNPNPKPNKKEKPQYRPPSSLDRTGQKTIRSQLPFDFRYSYTESSPTVRPIGLREPKYSPFGPGRLDREWTGVCAPAVDPKARSVEGAEDPKLEEKGRMMRDKVQGHPLSEAERKILVDKCLRHKTKRQINLGMEFLDCILCLLNWVFAFSFFFFFFFFLFLVYLFGEFGAQVLFCYKLFKVLGTVEWY